MLRIELTAGQFSSSIGELASRLGREGRGRRCFGGGFALLCSSVIVGSRWARR